MNRITMTHTEWLAEAVRRFGEDNSKWRFVCPSCGHVASVQDWKDAKAPAGAIGFSCVGRYVGAAARAAARAFGGKGGPCNYTGGGLFAINPVLVDMGDGKPIQAFAFADEVEPVPVAEGS